MPSFSFNPQFRGRLITSLGQGRFTCEAIRLDDPRRAGVFSMHHEAEELRVHHRATIPAEDARAVVVTLLASGRVPPLQATLLDLESAATAGRASNGSGARLGRAPRAST